MIGNITGTSVEKNRDSENEVRMLQTTIYFDDNAESVQLARPHGEDTNPNNDSKILVISVGDAYKIGILIDDGITPSMDKGEKKIYSVDGGAIKAYINFLKNGNLELNGNSKGVARQDDTTIIDGTTDAAFITWVATVSSVLNFLVTGSVPSVPTSVNGKINSSSVTVKTG
jgi:hypothetical protein